MLTSHLQKILFSTNQIKQSSLTFWEISMDSIDFCNPLLAVSSSWFCIHCSTWFTTFPLYFPIIWIPFLNIKIPKIFHINCNQMAQTALHHSYIKAYQQGHTTHLYKHQRWKNTAIWLRANTKLATIRSCSWHLITQ